MNFEMKDYDFNFVEIPLADLKIIFITDDKSGVSENTDIHMHSFFELFFVKEGNLSISLDGVSYNIGENQAMIIPPSSYHSSRPAPHAIKTSVFFTFEKRKTSLDERVFDELYSAFCSLSLCKIENAEYIGILLGMILENIYTDKLGKSCRIRASVTDLVFHIYDILKSSGEQRQKLTLRQNAYWVYKYEIERLLDKYYAQDVKLEFLSEKLYMTPQSITRIISAVYGKSFGELKTELKMRNAKKLLTETDKTVSEIAKEIGYSSTRGFLVAFSKYEGCTPSEYRKEAVAST